MAQTNHIREMLLTISILITVDVRATLIFTYKNAEATIFNKAEFSLTSNVIDEIVTKDRSDFANENRLRRDVPKTPVVDPTNSFDYAMFYRKTLDAPTNKEELGQVNTNLYSASSTQLKYQPSDFTVIDEVFKGDPQLDRLSRYFFENQEITPGQILVFNGLTSITFIIARQSQVGWRMPIISGSLYRITCPEGKTVFDISELNRLPTTEINTDTKGCTVVYLGTSAA